MPATTTQDFETNTQFPLRGLSITPAATSGNTDRRPSYDPTLELVLGDITHEKTDAIVNPVGPGFVDLAIRRVAGPGLVEAFHHRADELHDGKLLAGQAIVTPGFGLPAAHVIHCGPPVFDDDPARARRDLVACHVESLKLARAAGWPSVAFPAIGTGVYRYPAKEAAAIAVDTIVSELRRHGAPSRVKIVLATPEILRLYIAAAAAATNGEFWLVERGAVFSGLQRES